MAMKFSDSRNWLVKCALMLGAASALATSVTWTANGVARESSLAVEPVSLGGPPTFRRLTEDQYRRAIAQTFGEDIQVGGRFEPPVREEGLLAIGSSKVIVTPSGLEQYAIRAREISAQVLDDKHRHAILPCAAASAAFDPFCAQQFVGKYGRMLFRRPLTRNESAATLALTRRVTLASGSFTRGLSAGLASLLVSPAFVFRVESTEPDTQHPGRERLDVYSLAARISFLLWDSPPDAQLLDAAASGVLRTRDGLDGQVNRLMASPRLEQGTRAFFSDMLAYDLFNGLSKDAALFPIFNPKLRDDAKEQSLRTIVDHLLTRQRDYRDLFTTKDTFLSRSLGALYGVPVDARAFGGWMPYSFPKESPHAGLLTLPAFLMLDASHEGRSSPTIRGKTVRENFLCEKVPMPPANVNFSIVQNTSDPIHKTARSRLIAHRDDPVCAGCHKITDPIGLAMENYDPVGQFRSKENGEPIDASGDFDGKSYRDAIELTSLIHDSPSAPSCVVQRTFEYGVGRQIAPGEEKWLEYFDQSFAVDGFRYPALLRRLATSDAFQAVSTSRVAVNSQ
jgi:Protein of unknown function (DUF1592)/Protein of unknown function (DUF1588)/Protein of unknown function (DUF1595)/Protein of unknown function (DUF1585)/Protein of unknown function (DUF1587)